MVGQGSFRPARRCVDPADEDRSARLAERPTAIPARGWRDILVRVKREAKQDNVSLLAGGVAFFALFALVPALIALVSIYGLVADESTVVRQVQDTLGTAPQEVRNMITEQLRAIV
jgi:membrane protein